MPAVTRVPGVPAWVAGVANWRGRILPVLDLRSLLGADPRELDDDGRLIVLTDNAVAVGMLVDAVEGTTSLTDVAPFPAASAPVGSDLLSGQSPREDGPLAVLDVTGRDAAARKPAAGPTYGVGTPGVHGRRFSAAPIRPKT